MATAQASAVGRGAPLGRAMSSDELDLRRKLEGRLLGLRVNRYSWWCHWRELADYILPRRYKWIITPNQMARGSPINQHILDSTGTLAARNLASAMFTGTSDPTRIWFKLKIGHIDSTQTGPVSLWLAECERILLLIFQESNFYTSVAVALLDLVIFGTAVILMYEDFENVVNCQNPCAGEYYLENSNKNEADSFYREFTYTVSQCVQEFGLEACSPTVQSLYKAGGASLTRELVVAHAIEPNDENGKYGIPKHFKYREVYWEWGGSASPQGGSSYAPGFLRKKGYHEKPFAAVRWDLVANDAYGRSPAMDALPDVKQLQMEVRRKAQAIDKLVNPPMVADIQLKNQPASLLPGGVTYIAGMLSNARPGFAPVYTVQPPVKEIMEDLNEVRTRIKTIMFNDIFQTISQYETRSNVTAAEIDARKAEAFLMIGPVYTRTQKELFATLIERTFMNAARAGIFPKAPREIAGANINVEYVSMLEISQNAAKAASIERTMSTALQMMGVDPAIGDNVDFDYGLSKSSALLNNDPKLIRSPIQLAKIRAQRQQQQAQQQQAAMAEQLSAGAKNLGSASMGSDTALGALVGGRGSGGVAPAQQQAAA
jgi:hypothetical protein